MVVVGRGETQRRRRRRNTLLLLLPFLLLLLSLQQWVVVVFGRNNNSNEESTFWDLPSSSSSSSTSPSRLDSTQNDCSFYNDRISPHHDQQPAESYQNRRPQDDATSSRSINHPLWIPSFPGSGAEMVRSLLFELTDHRFLGGSIYEKDEYPVSCFDGGAITCKTHWPVLSHQSPLPLHTHNNNNNINKNNSNSNKEDNKTYSLSSSQHFFHNQTILLVRNPFTAIPSRFNHLWERTHGLSFHSQQAPEAKWNQWIQRNFPIQSTKYKEFVQTWMGFAPPPSSAATADDDFPYTVALVLPYEGLINPQTGGYWIEKLDALVRRTTHASTTLEFYDTKAKANSNDNTDNGVLVSTTTSTSTAAANCLWKTAIGGAAPKHKRSNHTYTPKFASSQHEQLLTVLRELHHEAIEHQRTDLATILQDYLSTSSTSS